MPIGSVSAIALFLALGALTGTGYAETGSAIPVDGPVAQVSTVTFSSPDNSSPYSVSFDDGIHSTTVAITTDGSATATEAGDLFVAALEDDPIAAGMMTGVNVTGTVTLTARTPGLTITLAEVVDTGAHMAIATVTAASAGTTYPVGRVVQLTQDVTQILASLPDTPTQGTITLTITHNASDVYDASLFLRDPLGRPVTASLTFAAGGNVTATGAAAVAAVAASKAAYGVAGLITAVAGTPAGAVVVVTITLPAGWSFDATASFAVVIGTGPYTIAAGTAAGAVLAAAVVYRPSNLSSPTLGESAPDYIDAGKEVPIAFKTGQRSVVVLDPGSAPALGAQVYYETAAGASRGKVLITPTATSLPLPGWAWRGRTTNSDGTVYGQVGAA